MSSLARTSASLGLALLATLSAACSSAEDERLSAVLITFDTTRRDAVSCYGTRDGLTPHLDQLAAQGVRYDAAFTVAPLTLPAHASMLTGLYPVRHTLRENGLWPLPSSAQTLAEKAQEAGYATGAFVAAVVLDASFGLDQGFDTYDSPERPHGSATSHYAERPASEVVDAALAWLEGVDRDQPFFLWVHVFDPHGPYEPPPAFRGRGGSDPIQRAYRGEVASADHEIGRLLSTLDARGALDESIVVAVSDHGEAFGEHEEFTHGVFCWQPTLHVPFLIRYPDGYRAGERSNEVTSVVDVHPTLLEAMGIAPPATIDGSSLFRRTVAEDRGVYFESYSGFLSYGWSPLTGWIDKDGKYVHCSEPRYFDSWRDPRETKNLIDERSAEAERAREAIRRITSRGVLAAEDEERAGADLVRAIQSLGYVGAQADRAEIPDPLAPSDRKSPFDAAEAYRDLLMAQELNNRGEYPQAEVVFRRILQTDPENYFALDRLAVSLIKQDRPLEAIEPLTRLLADGPKWAGSYFNLGACLREAGRTDDAVEAFLQATVLDPNQPMFREQLVLTLRNAGREDEAKRFEKVLGE